MEFRTVLNICCVVNVEFPLTEKYVAYVIILENISNGIVTKNVCYMFLDFYEVYGIYDSIGVMNMSKDCYSNDVLKESNIGR